MGTTVQTFQSLKPDFSASPLRSYTQDKFCCSDYRSGANASIYETAFGGIRLGAVGIFRHTGRGTFYGYRRMDHIRTDHIDDYLISMPIRGSLDLQQLGSSAEVAPGSFALTAMAHPFSVVVKSEAEHKGFDSLHVVVSGSLLRAQISYVDECCRRPIRVASGSGKIMATLFMLAIQESEDLSEEEAARFDHMLVGAISNTLSSMRPELSMARSRSDRVVEKAKHYVACNLSDPALCPDQIASFCNVSTSFLYKAFASCSIRLHEHIKESRLARAREALLSAELEHLSVAEIARSWGFSDAAYFNRVYKDRFNRTPGQERSQRRV